MGALADALVSKGGYNATDAANAESGPRAADLAKEFGVGSGGASSYPVPDIKLSDIGGSAVDFAKGLNSGVDDAFSQYLKVQQGQAKPLDLYTKLEGEAGVPQLRTAASSLSQQVNDLEDTIRNIEPTVNATTGNSLVTEGQRTGMITEQKRIPTQNLTQAGTSLGRVTNAIQLADSDIGNKVNLAMQGNAQELQPYQMQIQLKSDQAARLMTGFTADRETTLNLLLEKIHAQQHVSDQEFAQAAKLSEDEKNFQNEKSKLILQNTLDIQKQQDQYKAIGKYGMINPSTGQIIAGYGGGGGASSSGSFGGNSAPGLDSFWGTT